MISACGDISKHSHEGAEEAGTESGLTNGRDGKSIKLNKAVIVPPGLEESPNLDNPLDANDPGSAFSKNMKGLNLETLFKDDIKDVNKRFDRLEEAFISFRKEYEEIRPSIMRLTAIESDIQAIIEDLKSLTNDGGDVTKVEDTASLQNLPINHETEDIKSQSSLALENVLAAPIEAEAKVQDIRIGVHADKERIVIQLSDKIPYKIDLDNQEKVLIVRFSGLGDQASSIQASDDTKANIISSYVAYSSLHELDLIFRLNNSTEIIHTEWLEPSDQNTSHRLIVDLKMK